MESMAKETSEHHEASIWFRCDASATIGMGHLQRCLALAQALQHAYGASCHFALRSAGNQAWVRQHIPPEFTLHFLDDASPEQEASQFTHLLQQMTCHALVVDRYESTTAYLLALRSRLQGQVGQFKRFSHDGEARFPVIVIDDFATQPFYPCEAIVNPHLYAHRLSYSVSPGTRLLLGQPYALLKPEFLQHRQTFTRSYPTVATHLLITMGGADPHRVTEKVLSSLQNLDEFLLTQLHIRVVLGPAYRPSISLQAAMRWLPHGERIDQTKDMVSLMEQADIAISAAGGTLSELACLGVPSLILAITDTQQALGEQWAQHGGAVYLGAAQRVDSGQISTALKTLMLDPVERTRIGHQAQAWVDGQGASRVAKFICEELLGSHEPI